MQNMRSHMCTAAHRQKCDRRPQSQRRVRRDERKGERERIEREVPSISAIAACLRNEDRGMVPAHDDDDDDAPASVPHLSAFVARLCYCSLMTSCLACSEQRVSNG